MNSKLLSIVIYKDGYMQVDLIGKEKLEGEAKEDPKLTDLAIAISQWAKNVQNNKDLYFFEKNDEL